MGESNCARPEPESLAVNESGPASPSRRSQLGSRTSSLRKTPSRRHLQRPASNRKIGRRVGTDDEARLSRTGSSTKLVSSPSKVSPSKTPKAQPNYQKSKSFRRSHSIRSSKNETNDDDDDDDNDVVELLSQSSRRLLLSSSSRDFNFEEENADVAPQVRRTSVRKRNETIAQVDWKKEVLNEVTPDSPSDPEACSPTKNPGTAAKALTKVARIFSSSEGVSSPHKS